MDPPLLDFLGKSPLLCTAELANVMALSSGSLTILVTQVQHIGYITYNIDLHPLLVA
jgi:hypothetical protein